MKLKDGTTSEGKRILIDGQQRVTALMAALLGHWIINKDYRRVKIKIAFHPKDRKFEVSNPAIEKDKIWISDISQILSPEIKVLKFVADYCKKNSEYDQDEIYESIELLRGIVNNHIGLIELNSDLDIETVTEIFIRINSQGVELSQADFAMSKIAANEGYGGNKLRKCIDYFCHLAVAPEFYQQLADLDKDFASTDFFRKMTWLKHENDDLYDPSYTDMLRVAFTSEFKRGRLQDLVALLSGRNFVTRDYEESIAEESFKKLEKGIINFMNETNFKRFIMIIRSAGFIEPSMIRSRNAINFAYIVYLYLRANNIDSNEIETAEFSYAFWEAGLPQQMNTSVASSPYFKVFLASQIYFKDKGFLSRDITVQDLITHRGDVHHLFPKDYLKKNGLQRGKYNQIANYVIMQSEINIAIGNKSPAVYFSKLLEHCNNGAAAFGAITSLDEMRENFAMHCVPNGMENKAIEHYEEFLMERRKLISQKIKSYYFQL